MLLLLLEVVLYKILKSVLSIAVIECPHLVVIQVCHGLALAHKEVALDWKMVLGQRSILVSILFRVRVQ